MVTIIMQGAQPNGGSIRLCAKRFTYMKKILALLFLIPAFAFAQSQEPRGLEKAGKGLKAKEVVKYDEASRTLEVGDLLIPVSPDTHVKLVSKKKSYAVEFMLQKGTAIKSKSKSDVKKAWHSIEFESKKAAQDFIDEFRKAAK